MPHFIIIPPATHKLATINIDVEYARPGNNISHVPVNFEIFKRGNRFIALPIQTRKMRLLTNLSGPIEFDVQEEKIGCKPVYREIVEEIVLKLAAANVIERQQVFMS